jgi:cation transport ATPase
MLNETDNHRPRRIATVIALDGRTETELLQLLGAAPGLARLEQLEVAAPAGLCGCLDGQTIAIGNESYFAALGLSTSQLCDWPERMRKHGQEVLLVAVNGQTVGFLGIETLTSPVSEGASNVS